MLLLLFCMLSFIHSFTWLFDEIFSCMRSFLVWIFCFFLSLLVACFVFYWTIALNVFVIVYYIFWASNIYYSLLARWHCLSLSLCSLYLACSFSILLFCSYHHTYAFISHFSKLRRPNSSAAKIQLFYSCCYCCQKKMFIRWWLPVNKTKKNRIEPNRTIVNVLMVNWISIKFRSVPFRSIPIRMLKYNHSHRWNFYG